MAKVYEVTASREGGAWLVSIPELGVSAQVPKLSKAEKIAQDLVARETGAVASEVEVSVTALGDPAVREALEQAEALAREGELLIQRAAQERARVVREYIARESLTVREAAALLGMSFQRVQQLVKA